jgi:hypothetical protein
MNRRLIIFAGWCLAVFGGSIYSTYYAWSPFSDESSGARGFVGGPTHK